MIREIFGRISAGKQKAKLKFIRIEKVSKNLIRIFFFTDYVEYQSYIFNKINSSEFLSLIGNNFNYRDSYNSKKYKIHTQFYFYVRFLLISRKDSNLTISKFITYD